MKLSDLSPALQKRLGLKAARSKYGVSAAAARTVNGIRFDSKAEMRRYQVLLQGHAAGMIVYFLRQVPFHLPGGVVYRCDFMVVYPDRRIEYEDVKGVRTAMYALKRRQVEALYPVKIREVA